MGVPKIAVIALVVIVACPILLGYAFNLSETTETGYRESQNNPVNVTQLLMTGTAYNYAHANTQALNTSTYMGEHKIIPNYISTTTNRTSFPLDIYDLTYTGGNQPLLSTMTAYYGQFTYDHNLGGLKAQVYSNGVNLGTTSGNLEYIYYDRATDSITYTFFNGSTHVLTAISGGNYDAISFYFVGGLSSCTARLGYIYTPGNEYKYVDYSAGFKFDILPATDWNIKLPDKSHSVIYTMDLDSITDANYTLSVSGYPSYIFQKTTTGGDVSWQVLTWSHWDSSMGSGAIDPDVTIDLHYDPSRSDNTYQIYQNLINRGEQANGNFSYEQQLEFRYVGGWPTMVGEANYYLKYENDVSFEYANDTLYLRPYFNYLSNYSIAARTPVMRVDDAEFRAFEYQVIENQTLLPYVYKSWPSTTLSNPTLYGTSFTFGGITYAVKDGNITLGSKQIPVKDLVLSSVPNEGGTFDNRIGNTVISTSPVPSGITFHGKWSVNVTVRQMESFTYNHTEWHVGEFGWNGVDQNFLMVGLITCLGVFVALGIYARKSRSGGIIPLMIAVGCAAMVFFIMI